MKQWRGTGLLSICNLSMFWKYPPRAGCHTDGLPHFIFSIGNKKGRASQLVLFNANKIISITKSNLPPSDVEAEQFGIVLISNAKLGTFRWFSKLLD